MIRHALLRTIAGALAALLLVSCVTVRVNGPASDGTPAAEESAPADSASVEEPADAAEQVAEATKTPRRRATRTPSSEATKTPRKRVTRTPSSEATKTPRKRVTRTPTAVASAPDGDEIEADSGFRPDPNGFSFENYGNEDGITNLTPADVHRMFGDDACVRFKNGECVLTPAGRKWMREVNKSMAGGHCEGFAVLSTFMYVGQISPKDFGASSVDRLKIAGNEKLQREIAYWFTTQSTTPSAESERTDMTPVQVVDELAAQFDRQAAGAADFETYSLGIYKPGYEEGHAVTPYAVNELERSSSTTTTIRSSNAPSRSIARQKPGSTRRRPTRRRRPASTRATPDPARSRSRRSRFAWSRRSARSVISRRRRRTAAAASPHPHPNTTSSGSTAT